jgi:ribosomal protein L11 methyltransferase
MPTWFECSTLAEAEAVDAVAEVFGRLGQGVAIEEPFVSSADGEQVRVQGGKPVLVKTYLPDDQETDARRRRLEEAVWHLGRLRRVESLRVKPLQEEDWAEAWKKHFFVNRVGERLVVVPSWRRHRPAASDLLMRLDPGMAFGTGLHPTTRLCLRALEKRIRPGAVVLDLGTGSGILAIAAARLGARQVVALDVDATAVRIAAENLARNGLSGLVELGQGTLPHQAASGKSFDLAVANISLRVLRGVCPELRNAIGRGGVALLSGLLEQDAPDLLGVLRGAGWHVLEQLNEAEWTLLAVTPHPLLSS